MKPKIQKSASCLTLHISLLLLALSPVPYAIGQQYGWSDISANLPDFPGDTLIINNPPDTVVAGIHSVFFINDDEGWISTNTFLNDSCMILHTIDGGNSWEVQPIMDYIVAIEMLDELEGYAAAREGTIYHTSNGGDSWEFHAQTFAWLRDMDFPPNSDTGYVCGDNSAAFRITPSGAEEINPGTISDLDGLSFPVTEKGWACGGAIINFFENGSWVSLPSLPAGTYDDIFFIDDQYGWVCGTVLGKTINGTDWTECSHYPKVIGSMYKLFFLDNLHGWVVCASGQILFTTDGGDNWAFQAEGMTEEFLAGIQFTSETNGYIIGNNKTLLKYGPISGVEQPAGGEAGKQVGVEVWPNPTRGEVSIQSAVFSRQSLVIGQQSVIVEIIDLYGNLLELRTPGTPGTSGTLELDLSTYPSGTYFVRVCIENRMIVKKILKL